ncbi:MAG: segregation/condensation protein A [Oscillospiraceae bacterium]|nr:segregation/condensation protein A [Oscillospiraceae bacterium]
MIRINYKIEDFEGPLDLLLVLISKNKMSIADVEIITIINQYLAVINASEETDLDSASEFIDMAARLVYLKSVYLLPKDDEGEKLKAELQGQLIEYSRAKRAAQMLRDRFIGDSLFLRPAVEIKEDYTYSIVHPVDDLIKGYARLRDRSLNRTPPAVQRFEPIVTAPVVSVASKIYTLLKGMIKRNVTSVHAAFEGMKTRSEAVAMFLAVLELVRAHRITVDEKGGLELIRKEKNNQ